MKKERLKLNNGTKKKLKFLINQNKELIDRIIDDFHEGTFITNMERLIDFKIGVKYLREWNKKKQLSPFFNRDYLFRSMVLIVPILDDIKKQYEKREFYEMRDLLEEIHSLAGKYDKEILDFEVIGKSYNTCIDIETYLSGISYMYDKFLRDEFTFMKKIK